MPGSHTGGIRLDGLRTGITRRSGDHGPSKVGCFCTKPLTFLIYLGGLKLPCIDSAQEAEMGLASPLPGRPSGRGGLQVALPGQGRALREGEPSFWGAAVRTS